MYISGSELKLTVSGNTAEQQLKGLDGSTTYTVTISSLLGGQESLPTTTTFTTTARGQKILLSVGLGGWLCNCGFCLFMKTLKTSRRNN